MSEARRSFQQTSMVMSEARRCYMTKGAEAKEWRGVQAQDRDQTKRPTSKRRERYKAKAERTIPT